MIKRKPVRALLGMGVSLGLILACVVLVTPALASPAVNMSIVPASQSVTVGDTFTVDIQLSGTDPVRGASAYIDFDATKLEVESITPGTALDTVLQNAFDNSAGHIDYSAGKLSGTLPTGTFTLATIEFEALAVTSTPAQLTFVFDAGNNRVTDVITTGSVSVLGTATGGEVTVAAEEQEYTVTFDTNPEATGTITFGGVTFNDGNTVDVAAATYSIVAHPGSGYDFDSWETTGGLSVVSTGSVSTTCTVSGAGTLRMVQTQEVSPVGGTAYPPNKLLMVLPWIFVGAAIIVGATLLVRRRRSAVR